MTAIIKPTEMAYDETISIIKNQYQKNLENFWLENEEQFFGSDLHPAIEFVGFEVREYSDILINQNSRGGSLNKKKIEIKQNIERNGYKTKYIPPCILATSGEDFIITGNTRIQILAEMGITKIVVAVYRPVKGATKHQIEDAKLHCGQTFNTSHDPASPPAPEDIIRTLNSLVELFNNTNGQAGVALDYDELLKRTDQLCGKGVFQPQTRHYVAQQVCNNYDPNNIVIAWQESKNAKYRLQEYLERYNFVDNENVIYFYSSHSSSLKAWGRALKLANANPDKEIRVVVHTAVLEGNNYLEIYKNRIRDFNVKFEDWRNATIGASKGSSKALSRIVVYAAYPAIGTAHDLESPLRFNPKTQTVYQKETGFSFSLYEEEDLTQYAA